MDDRSERAKTLILGSLRNMIRALDAGTLSPECAAAQLDWWAQVERLAGAGKTLAAGIAVAGEPWRRSGERSAEEWLAKRTDTTVGDARSVLNAAAHLPNAPATNEAFTRGELSVKKAEAVAGATAVAPETEDRLLHAALHGTLKRVRDESARVRAAADPDPSARHERIRQSRFWRRWTDADGARCGTYRLTPEDGARLEAAAQPFVDAEVDTARRTQRDDSFEALAADGLVAMGDARLSGATDTPTARGARGRKRLANRRELIAIVDLAALQRGHAHVGEMCEIAGVGPVPVDVAREVFGDAILRIVIRDGVDIKTVVHTGRTASAVQETAILVRQDGRCVRPGCDRAPVEIDHGVGYAHTGGVTIDDLAGACGVDHDNKSHHGHSWRRERDGTYTWVLPDGTEERERPPP